MSLINPVMPMGKDIGNPGLKNYGLSEQNRLKVRRFGPDLSEDAMNTGQIYSCNNDTIGFFFALFKKA